MLHHWKIAYRSLSKNRFFSILNVLGLTIGLTCFLFIALYVVDELSYDRYNQYANRIFRVQTDIVMGGSELILATSADPMGELLKQDYPEVETYTRVFNSSGAKLIKKGDQFLTQSKLAHADSTYFDVFTVQAIHGDLKKALTAPNSVVINRSMAVKYFGTTDVVGKSLETNDNGSTIYNITGVMEDFPKTAHFRPDFLFSMQNARYNFGQLLSHNFHTYLLLKDGVTQAEMEQKLRQYILKHIMPLAKNLLNINSIEEFENSGNKLNYSLIPVTDIHLHSNRFPELSVNSNVQYIYIFSVVALFVLLIACINFMNLSTARSANRAREVGIRKVLGSAKSALIKQFLTESTLLAYLSIVFALLIAILLLPLFNSLAGKDFSTRDLFQPYFLAFLLVLPLLVGVLAGIYPAFFLSSFQPLAVLKSKFSTGKTKGGLRSALVVVQFVTSIILIVSTLVIYGQLNYIQTKKIGFNKEQVLIINNTFSLNSQQQAFKNELLQNPNISGAANTGYLPVAESSRSDQTFSTSTTMGNTSSFNMQSWDIDHDYIPFMGMELKYGRNFSRDFGTDSSGVIINEAAAALMGIDNPVGQFLYTGNGEGGTTPHQILGVVKNFHYESLKQNIGPLAFLLGSSNWSMGFKVEAANIGAILPEIQAVWNRMAPGIPFEYSFLDDNFNKMYAAEMKIGTLALSFSIITILVACLGLFGLAAFIAEQRNKEIGVRKVLGASVQQIVQLLTKDFVILVGIAAVIAFPIAWLVMSNWLNNFAFKTSIGWWVFALSAAIAAVIALLTVGAQAIKAAITNPIKSLRSE